MWTYLRSIIAIGVFFLAMSGSSWSQGLCFPDTCYFRFWSPSSTVQLTLGNGCVVEVTYQSRVGCFNVPMYGITGIKLLTQGCSGASLRDLFAAAERELMAANPGGLPLPPKGTCIAPWQVIKPLCWKYASAGCGDTAVVACNSAACCITDYVICRDTNGKVTTYPYSWSSTGHCDTNGWPHCDSICGPPDDSGSVWSYVARRGFSKDFEDLSNESREEQLSAIGAAVFKIEIGDRIDERVIHYEVAKPGSVVLAVSDESGKEVAHIERHHQVAGPYTLILPSGTLGSGKYNFQLHTGYGWHFGSFSVSVR